MAWSLDSYAAGFIPRSVEVYLAGHENPAQEAARILGYQRSEGVCDIPTVERIQLGCDDDVACFGVAWAAERIAEHAERVGLTSNGAHAFYCDDGGWVEIPFADDEDDGGY